jgi:fructosamine-3-kinase
MSIVEEIASQKLGWDKKSICVKKTGTGDVNSSFIISNDKEKLFIKIQNRMNLPTFYEEQIAREISGLKLCQEHNIPCPKIIDYSLEHIPFIITEYMDYPLLSQEWPKMTDSQKKYMKYSALDYIDRLQQISSDTYGSICETGQIGKYQSWSRAFVELIKIAVNDCIAYKTLNHEESEIIIDAAIECAKSLTEMGDSSLNHLDFHWNNIFVCYESGLYKIRGIVDFGSALYAPKYMDQFRLDGGFLYGTEKFYTDIEKTFLINKHQLFSADLLNTIDYFVFLSLMKTSKSKIKSRLINICKAYKNDHNY